MRADAAMGLDNLLRGSFGEMWLRTVAGGCRVLHEGPGQLDLEKRDVTLTWNGRLGDSGHPTVKIQVKTIQGDPPDGDTFRYDLDVDAYRVLSDPSEAVPRVLVVIWISGDWIDVGVQSTSLLGRGAWVCLTGRPSSENLRTVAVELPGSNTIDAAGIERMLREVGVRQSSVVPAINPWDSL